MEILLISYPFPNMVLPTLAFLICFLLLLGRQYRKKVNNHKNLPPGKFGWPMIGETMDFAKSASTGTMGRFIVDRMARYSPKVFKTFILGEKMAIFCGPSGNKLIFSSENKHVRTWLLPSLVKIVIPDIEESVDDEGMRRRKLFGDFLKPHVVQKCVPMMDTIVRKHLDAEWAPNVQVLACPLVKKLAFHIMCSVFIGTDDPDVIGRLDHAFEIVSAGLFSVMIDLPVTPYGRARRAAKSMRDELHKIIQKQRQLENNRDSQVISSSNFISYLFSATDSEGKLLSETEIATLVLVLLVAGHETTSSLSTSLVYYLADHPHVYAQALREQLEIKNSKGEEKLLTWEDMRKMKYSRNVINEVLRLAPPAAGGFREIMHDINYEGFTIPKGWKIFWTVNSTHKDPKCFSDPEIFDPMRFEGNGPAPYCFTPFGGGPRMCPGNEFALHAALVFMHNLLINFKWEKIIPKEKIVLAPSSFPEKGLPIKLQRTK